jgi:putative hydrolase of the HAD superfamily
VKGRAVFFDAGDTLVRPHPSFSELFSQVLSDAGHVVDPHEVQSCWAVAMRRFQDAADTKESWSTSTERSRRFWLSVYRTFLDELGLTSHDGLEETLYATFSDMANYRLFPDVMPTVEALDAAGHAMGVVSNFEAWLDVLLDSLGLADLLPVRAISGIEGIEKPDPTLFRIAMERAGVDAADCVYVGDSIDFDVIPAASLGMTPVLLDRRNRFGSFDGLRITSMEQLPAVVQA